MSCNSCGKSAYSCRCTPNMPAPRCDLSITKTSNLTTQSLGQPVTFTINVANLGPSSADGAVLRDMFPVGFTLTSAVVSSLLGGASMLAPTKDELTVGARINVLPPNSQVQLTLVGTFSQAGTHTNSATIASPPSVEDTNLINNAASVPVTITPPYCASVRLPNGGFAFGQVDVRDPAATVQVTDCKPNGLNLAGNALGEVFTNPITNYATVPVYRCDGITILGWAVNKSVCAPECCGTGTVVSGGNNGIVGPQGDPGPVGATGPVGPAGAAGLQGPIGLTGASGAVGAVGPAGSAGATGSQGPIGLTGANGAVGPAGPASTVPGPVGPAGPTGPQGASGGVVAESTFAATTTTTGLSITAAGPAGHTPAINYSLTAGLAALPAGAPGAPGSTYVGPDGQTHTLPASSAAITCASALSITTVLAAPACPPTVYTRQTSAGCFESVPFAKAPRNPKNQVDLASAVFTAGAIGAAAPTTAPTVIPAVVTGTNSIVNPNTVAAGYCGEAISVDKNINGSYVEYDVPAGTMLTFSPTFNGVAISPYIIDNRLGSASLSGGFTPPTQTGIIGTVAAGISSAAVAVNWNVTVEGPVLTGPAIVFVIHGGSIVLRGDVI